MICDMFSIKKNSVRHAWREPVYGALRNWLDFWYLRIGWAIFLAATYAFIRGLRSGESIDGALSSFFPACGVSILIIGMYALIQRRIELYDDYLVIVQGRGGDRFRYSDIGSIVEKSKGKHRSLMIYLKSGKRREVFLSSDLPLSTVIEFLSGRGIKWIEEAKLSKAA